MGLFDEVREIRQVVREVSGTAREVRRGADEVARTKGTLESFDPRSDAERDRAVLQARRFEGQILREDIRIMDLNEQYRARRDAYGAELPQQGNGAAWGYEAPVQGAGTARYAAVGAAAAPMAASQPATSQAPTGRVTVTKELIESMSKPLDAALNARTPAERDAALDGYINAVNRIGPNTDIVSIGGHLDFTNADGRKFRVPLPPAGQTFRPGDIAGPVLQGNPELEQALRARVAAANGQSAPAPQPLAPQPPVPGTATAPQAGGQSDVLPAQTSPGQSGATSTSEPSKPASIAAASGKTAATYSLRTNTAEMPKIAANQVADLQGLLVDAGYDLTTRRQPDGKDGKYGPKTEAAVNAIAKAAGVDPKTIDFTNTQDPETVKFMQKLQEVIDQKQGKTQPVVQQGPSEQELEAQRRAEAERARLAAEEARIPEAIRGTAYDPRISATMSQAERDALARRGLHALDEIASENGARNPETLARKLREVQKDAGLLRSGEASPETLAALGMAVAERGGLAGRNGNLYASVQTQAEANAAAAIAFHALDETAGITRNPEVLARKVREFERENRMLVDGVVDAPMLQALEQAVAARGGLTQVRGGTEVATQGGEPPAPSTVQTSPQAPAATTGRQP